MNKQTKLEFCRFNSELAPYFGLINREWISDMFVVEPIDDEVLSKPQQSIIDKGGHIYFAKHPTLGIIGTCALLKKGEGIFELTKMGVLSKARGLKVGEHLLQYVITRAIELNTSCLFLLTNSKCEAAIHLYQKNGFEHDEQIMRDYGKAYQRCNVAMRHRRQ